MKPKKTLMQLCYEMESRAHVAIALGIGHSEIARLFYLNKNKMPISKEMQARLQIKGVCGIISDNDWEGK